MLGLIVPPSPLAVADEVIEWAAKIFVVLHMSAMAQSCRSRLLVRQPISRWAGLIRQRRPLPRRLRSRPACSASGSRLSASPLSADREHIPSVAEHMGRLPADGEGAMNSPTMDPMNSSKRSSLLHLHDQASLRIRPSRVG